MAMFEFYSAGRIIFGSGSLQKVGEVAAELGRNALIVASHRSRSAHTQLEAVLHARGLGFSYFSEVTREPTVEIIDHGVEVARQAQVDFVIGIGGGSCLDAAKAIAGMVNHPGSVLNYLEGVGSGAKISRPTLPCLAIPTTSGTGAEVTKNAVIAASTGQFKKSLRSPALIPKVALVDPALTLSLPSEQTAFSGMDALTQCIEAYVSRKAQPIAATLALEGITHGARGLLTAVQDGTNLAAREAMSLCSLLSGLALANSGLGAVHGIGAALGALFEIPHGLACAITLPAVMAFNLPANPQGYATVGIALTGKSYASPAAAAIAGVEFIRHLSAEIGIPRQLGDLGIQASDIPRIAQNSGGSSMQGNPREMSEADVISLLGEIL